MCAYTTNLRKRKNYIQPIIEEERRKYTVKVLKSMSKTVVTNKVLKIKPNVFFTITAF